MIHALLTNILPTVGGAYAFIVGAKHVTDTRLPSYVTWTFLAASVPITYSLKVFMLEIRNKRRAKALGATLAPRWDGRLPGNYDLLKEFLTRIDNGYLGTGSHELLLPSRD